MKKLGFTLAEVLVTLGIVGVVAALTTPALISSSRNEANGAKLAVVVSSIENAFANALAQEGADDLFHTSMWNCVGSGNMLRGNYVDDDGKTQSSASCFLGNLGKYLVLNGHVRTNKNSTNPITIVYGAGKGFHPMTANGGTNKAKTFTIFPGDLQNGLPIYMKNGAVFFIGVYAPKTNLLNTFSAQREKDLRAQGTNYIYNAADIVIDVNGKAGPNTYGRDIFSFDVSEKGILYPAGGIDYAISDLAYGSDCDYDVNDIWSNSNSDFACTDDSKGSNENLRGIGCTARLIEENYKMNY